MDESRQIQKAQAKQMCIHAVIYTLYNIVILCIMD